MDLQTLRELVPILSSSGVLSFDFNGLRIVFKGSPEEKVTPAAIASSPLPFSAGVNLLHPKATDSISTEKTEGVVVPQGLEEEMTADAILNWSVQDTAPPVPLTDDVPMSDLPEAANV